MPDGTISAQIGIFAENRAAYDRIRLTAENQKGFEDHDFHNTNGVLIRCCRWEEPGSAYLTLYLNANQAQA